MGLHFKEGVNLRGMSPQIGLAIAVASECFAAYHEDCLITSVTRNGTFAECGYHATGNAVDIAVRRLSGEPIPAIVVADIIKEIRVRIGREGGGQYDVVDEMLGGSGAFASQWTGAHIHIEFDPK